MPFKKGYIPWNKGLDWQPRSAFKKGCISPNKGKKFSLESRLKMSNSAKGKIVSEKTRFKLSESHKGEKSYSWKGGITPLNKSERIRFNRTMQKLVFERDDYTCQMCSAKGVPIQVDHIQKWADYVELRFSMDNCRTLCMDCHYKITFGKPKPLHIKTWGHNLRYLMQKGSD